MDPFVNGSQLVDINCSWNIDPQSFRCCRRHCYGYVYDKSRSNRSQHICPDYNVSLGVITLVLLGYSVVIMLAIRTHSLLHPCLEVLILQRTWKFWRQRLGYSDLRTGGERIESRVCINYSLAIKMVGCEIWGCLLRLFTVIGYTVTTLRPIFVDY